MKVFAIVLFVLAGLMILVGAIGMVKDVRDAEGPVGGTQVYHVVYARTVRWFFPAVSWAALGACCLGLNRLLERQTPVARAGGAPATAPAAKAAPVPAPAKAAPAKAAAAPAPARPAPAETAPTITPAKAAPTITPAETAPTITPAKVEPTISPARPAPPIRPATVKPRPDEQDTPGQ